MIDTETTFSVEVLGFPGATDPEVLAANVAKFFGISIEEGRRLVKKAPIRVKRNAPADVVQQLVRQLRKLGADILVRNEQTGDERTYRLADARRPSQDFAPPKGAAAERAHSSEETLPSEDDAEPAAPEEPPNVEVLAAEGAEGAGAPADAAGDTGAPAGDAPPADADAPRAELGSVPSDPGAADPRTSSPISTPVPGAAISLPPPSQPIIGVPRASQPKLDYCESCTRPIDKGDTCTKCGWSNADKERYCRQCKKKLSLVSAISRRPPLVALIAIVGIAAFAGAFVLFGGFAGAGALALCVGLAFVGDALTMRYACKTCTVAVYSERLVKQESQRLRAARGKSLSVAIACALITAGFLAFTGAAGHKMSDSAYGIAWTVTVPRTHSQIGSEVTQIKVPTGNRRMRVQYAQRPFVGGNTYFLAHIQYTYPSDRADRDKAGLEAAMKQVIEVAFAGAAKGNFEAVGDSLQVAFSGTFHGKQVSGRLRGTQYDHDMVFVAVTSGSESDVAAAVVEPFLSDVAVDHEGR